MRYVPLRTSLVHFRMQVLQAEDLPAMYKQSLNVSYLFLWHFCRLGIQICPTTIVFSWSGTVSDNGIDHQCIKKNWENLLWTGPGDDCTITPGTFVTNWRLHYSACLFSCSQSPGILWIPALNHLPYCVFRSGDIILLVDLCYVLCLDPCLLNLPPGWCLTWSFT